MQATTQLSVAAPAGGAPAPTENYSNFMLTGNTNHRPTSLVNARIYSDVLKGVLERFFTLPVLGRIVKVKPGTKITKVQVREWGVELGTHPQGQRIHFHAFLKFTHTGSMQLSIPDIQQELLALFPDMVMIGVPKPRSMAIHVRWVPAQEEMLARYIKKQTKH